MVPCQPGQPLGPGQKGGAATGPKPTDRGKAGRKQHVRGDRTGKPLSVLLSAANCPDATVFEAVLAAVAPIKRPLGRPRKRPATWNAAKAYDTQHCRDALRRRGIACRIARKGIESSERLGRHRWVVERTLAWRNQFRRLTVRYERQALIHQAFLELGCALICWHFLQAGF